MTPPYAHWHMEPETRAGCPPRVVLMAPGIHGAGTRGTHGIGVSTPRAAAVAAATVGFARLLHMPNGGMLAPPALSIVVAAGRPSIITLLVPFATRVDGASPKEHCSIAPITAF